MRDMKGRVGPAQTIKPAAARTATVSGTGVDLKGYDAAVVLFDFGTWSSGSWTPSVEESDDNSAWSAVAAADLEGSLTVVDDANDDDTIQKVAYKGNKRYIRGVLTTASSPASLLAAASVVRGRPAQKPVA